MMLTFCSTIQHINLNSVSLWRKPTLQDCGVRKLTVVDSGRVVVSNLARQSLYTSDDRGAPKATAILKHLVERCPSVVSLHFLPIETVLPPFFFTIVLS